MKEIKSIMVSSFDFDNLDEFTKEFDKLVNEELKNGFVLVKREFYNTIPVYISDGDNVIFPKLYAELEREV